MRRDQSLDVLRGIMLVVMGIDHFGEPMSLYTWQFAGFVSAAEGFVFLSGLLVGLVYSPSLQRGPWVLERRLWHRAGTIYVYHLVALLAVFFLTVGSNLTGASWQTYAPQMHAEPLRALLTGLILVYEPPMLDVLPLYFGLLLVAPLALRLWDRYPRAGVAVVLVGSAGLWLAGQFGARQELVSLLPQIWPVHIGSFDFFGWQALFVLGMLVGYRRFALREAAFRFSPFLLTLSSAVVIALFTLRHGYWENAWLQEYRHIDRESVAWLRLINFLSLVYVVSAVVALHRRYCLFQPLAFAGRWLAFLGRHSLQVFTYHLVVLYCYIPFRWGEYALSDDAKWLASLIFLASLSLPAWWHERRQTGKIGAARALRPAFAKEIV